MTTRDAVQGTSPKADELAIPQYNLLKILLMYDVASFQVELDGVYRISETEIGPLATRGRWTAPNNFEIDAQQIGYSAGRKLILTFEGDTLAFQESPAGEVAYGMVPLQNTAFERLAWYESAEAQMGTMRALLLLFLSAVVLWPLGAVLRRRKREPDPAWRRAVWVGWVVSALNLAFLLVVLFTFGEELIFGVRPLIRVVLVIPIATSILAIVTLALTTIVWVRGHGSFLGRLYYSLIALASVLFVLFAGCWNMLGWRF